MPLPGPGRGIWRWMAVRGYALRAAELAGAAAGPMTSVVSLVAGCDLLGVAAAGGGGAVVAIVLAAVLVAVVFACCDRMALSAMLARPVSEVEHPELYRLVRELSKDGRLPVPRLYVSPAEQPNSFSVGRGPRSAAICCTEGLLRVLDEAELRGVLGHELAHVSGHDVLGSSLSAGLATVITFPAAPARLGRVGPAGLGRLRPGPRRARARADAVVRAGRRRHRPAGGEPGARVPGRRGRGTAVRRPGGPGRGPAQDRRRDGETGARARRAAYLRRPPDDRQPVPPRGPRPPLPHPPARGRAGPPAGRPGRG